MQRLVAHYFPFRMSINPKPTAPDHLERIVTSNPPIKRSNFGNIFQIPPQNPPEIMTHSDYAFSNYTAPGLDKPNRSLKSAVIVAKCGDFVRA
jgi:hypothetical protein